MRDAAATRRLARCLQTGQGENLERGLQRLARAIQRLGQIGGDTHGALSIHQRQARLAHVAPLLAEHLRLVYVAFPVLMGLISLLVILGYPIDEKKQRELRDEIERRAAQGAVPPAILESDGTLGAAATETVRE